MPRREAPGLSHYKQVAGIRRSPETAVISDNGAINLRTHHERPSRQGDGAIAAETDRKREASGLCGAPQGGGTVAGDYLGDAGRETGRSGAAGAAEGQQVTITTHYRESLLTGCRGCDTVAAASVLTAKNEAPHRWNGLRLLCSTITSNGDALRPILGHLRTVACRALYVPRCEACSRLLLAHGPVRVLHS